MAGAAEEPSAARVTWLGHATVLVELDGRRLITDPVLRPRVAHLRRQHASPELPERLDAVLLSHLHRDHADVPTLRRVPRGVPIIGPLGTTAALARAGMDAVREVEEGERVEVGGVGVLAVAADHEVTRRPGGPGTPSIGFVLEGSRRVYFAGDTDLFAGMAEIGRGGLDLALLPVWGWGPTIGPGHLDPERAARAAALLRPRVAVPIHWGTYLPIGFRHTHPALLRDPGPAFAAAVRELAPDVRTEVLAHLGSLALPARGAPARPVGG